MAGDAEDVVNYGGLLKRSIWALTVVATLFLGVRVYAKLFLKRFLWWDDCFLIVSWVCFSGTRGVTPSLCTRPISSLTRDFGNRDVN